MSYRFDYWKKVIFVCAGMGMALIILLYIVLMLVMGIESVSVLVIDYSPAIYILFFGLILFPFVKNCMN